MTLGRRTFTFLASLFMVVIFAGSNIALQNWLAPVRLDMTSAKHYTLSNAAVEIAAGLTEPVDLEFVYSRGLAADFPDIRNYGARLRELLNEIALRSEGNVRIREVDPAPFSDEEDQVLDAGLEAAPTDSGDPLYFGIVGRNSVDDRIVIPYLSPQRESLIEYDLVKLISQLDDPAPPRIGVITDLRDFTGTGQSSSDLYILREIARSFEIVQISENFVFLPDNLDALLIVHPPELSERQQYEIDQFLLSNGRALIALDPAARSTLTARGRRTRLTSDLGLVEQTLGLDAVSDVVIDRTLGLPVERYEEGRRIVENQPLFLAPPPNSMSRTDPVTADLNRAVNFGAPGRLKITPAQEVSFSPLIQSSEDAALIWPQIGGQDVSPRELLTGYDPFGEAYVLAGRLSGNLVSAFTADAIPPVILPDDPVQRALIELPTSPSEHLTQSTRSADIVLVADSDLFDDVFFVNPANDAPLADNAAFVLNALDNLAGNQALVRLRSRTPSARSMLRVDAMRAEARERLYDEQALLEARLNETEARLSELRTQGAGGGFLSTAGNLDEAQAAELEDFRTEAISIRRRLREVEREFRADVDKLENRLVFMNMWLAPIMVAMFGVGLWSWRTFRTGR